MTTKAIWHRSITNCLLVRNTWKHKGKSLMAAGAEILFEASIYNHLYTFFSRYYEDGDFISKRRYSRSQRYAIPYNGEEVHLHWANNDQYYVKSDEHFRNYDWKAPNGVMVHFRLRNADVEQDNVKGERRYFIPLVSETIWDTASDFIVIPFEYRPLYSQETSKYGTRNQQDKIITETMPEIYKLLNGNVRAMAALEGEHRRNDNDSASHLEHHLHQYVRRNNSDFFIHKDLSGFLNRELDFYLKNEVLNLENIVTAGQDIAEGWFQQLRLTKNVGRQIIAFLAQIESFQKALWEKRKFITDTQYCVRVGIIDEIFYPEIVKCDAQWDEWDDQLSFDLCVTSPPNGDTHLQDRRSNFLDANPTLVVDTRHFEQDFVDRLIASFENLDAITDGFIVKSDNWQALNLLSIVFTNR